MNSAYFLTIIFLPFIFFLYLVYMRLSLSYINKKVLDFGLIASIAISLASSTLRLCLNGDKTSIFLTIANLIFLFLAIVSCIFFKCKKQFMFTKLRYNIFLSLLISVTYVFILSNNLIVSYITWVFSGIIIYVFSYLDIFKTNSDYNSNRFYSIFLLGDFAFLLAVFVLIKFAIASDNFSYILNFEDIKSILSYILGNSDIEYIIVPSCLIVALFSRCFIFPFSCFFSFLTNASNLFYLVVYSIITPIYALILFLKLDLFETAGFYFKIYLLISIVFCLFSLLFEKHFKIIFGYILSVVNATFIISYFYDKTMALTYIAILYTGLIFVVSMLFIKDKLSLNKRIINKYKGFIQERIAIFLFEDIERIMSAIIDFIDKKILKSFFVLFSYIVNVIGYYYMTFIQSRKVTSILKGVLIIFALFAIFAIFIALFGNFGEMQI